MTASQTSALRYWIPQGLRDLYNRWSGTAIRYQGRYPDWNSAVIAARGYGDERLIDFLTDSASSVQRGEAVWEQDGVTRTTIPPDFPQLACLAQVALRQGGSLSVLDFGGGLGSSYWQCRTHLRGLGSLHWCIVEQPALTERGRSQFQTEELTFHDSLRSCLGAQRPQVILLSSVLQYLEHPYELLQEILDAGIPYLLIDRHPQSMTEELITVQKVPSTILASSYPCWLFDKGRMEGYLGAHRHKELEWQGKDPPILGRGIGATFSGSFWGPR